MSAMSLPRFSKPCKTPSKAGQSERRRWLPTRKHSSRPGRGQSLKATDEQLRARLASLRAEFKKTLNSSVNILHQIRP